MDLLFMLKFSVHAKWFVLLLENIPLTKDVNNTDYLPIAAPFSEHVNSLSSNMIR